MSVEILERLKAMAKRTGLRTLHSLLTAICQLLATWTPALLAVLPPDKHVYLQAVNQACTDFVFNVNVSDILDDEIP